MQIFTEKQLKVGGDVFSGPPSIMYIDDADGKM